jgi:hypothetical protein
LGIDLLAEHVLWIVVLAELPELVIAFEGMWAYDEAADPSGSLERGSALARSPDPDPARGRGLNRSADRQNRANIEQTLGAFKGGRRAYLMHPS